MADAVVIGSGPNGLVAANLLADAGWRVVVLEAQPEPGGAVRSGELTEPGFTHDLFSAFYPMAAASPLISGLGLDAHGLRWRRAPLVLAHPLDDGRCAVLSQDLEVTAASVDAFSPGDGEAWRRLFDLWQRTGRHLLRSLLQPFPPIGPAAAVLGSLRPSEVLPFVRFALLPVRRLAEEEFGGEGAPLLLAGNSLHADLAPESVTSGFFGWLLCMLGQSVGFPVPEGGAGQLTAALVRRLEARGGTVRCNEQVTRIEVRAGRASAVSTADGTQYDAPRAVIADVSAPALYGELLRPEDVPARVRDGLRRRFDIDSATVKIDWAMDAPIPWVAEEARRAGTVHLGESLDDLSEFAAALARRARPEQPYTILGQMAVVDPTRSPAGTDTVWAYTHLPPNRAWSDDEVAEVVRQVEDHIERLAPGFRSQVRARHVFTPAALQEQNANLIDGAINGGTAQLHQQLVFRPVPGLGGAGTPVDGLFLGSAAAHPGGGVHGACGANAARAALAQRRPWRALLDRL